MRMSAFEPETIKNLFEDMRAEATEFVRSCDAEAEILADYKLYMRYAGQGWEIPVSLTAEQAANPNADLFMRLFEDAYQQLFARTVEGLEVEITVWSVNATTKAKHAEPVDDTDLKAPLHHDNERALFDPATGKVMRAALHHRDELDIGFTVNGPAAITEDETTIIVPTSRFAVALGDGCIALQTKEEA